MTILPDQVTKLSLTNVRGSAMQQSSPDDTRYPFPAVVAGLVGGAAAAAITLAFAPVGVVVGAAAVTSLLLGSSIKFADQWEKAIVLRMGKYRGLRGPGMFFVVPIIDRVSYHIDQRIQRLVKYDTVVRLAQ